MKDPIDRNATVDAIKSGYIDDTSDVECPEECNAMLDWAIETIEGMPSEELDTDRIYTELSKVYNIKGLPDEAIDIIGDLMLSLELPSTQKEPHWIPCKDHLPKEDGLYEVTVHPDYIVPGGESVDALLWLDGKWKYHDFGHLYDFPDPIIAWKPLSEPYVERNEE